MTQPRPQSMLIVPGHATLAEPLRAGAVALGNFDGVHRGHVALFGSRGVGLEAHGGPSVAFTFEPHPARLLHARSAPPLISTLARKLELIAAAGIDVCVVEPFTAELAALTPDAFVEQVLVRALGAPEVCVGYDFTFGKGRAGGPTQLRALGERFRYALHVLDPVAVGGIVCSSTKVRELVSAGRVDEAAPLLGRDFELDGEVVHGAGRGRTIGVPTLNLRPASELLPGGGVYAGWALLPSGERYAAAINVGTNPTFTAGTPGAAPVTIEAHLLDFSGADLYGVAVRLGFLTRLREERRFPGARELVAQIREDIEAARRVTSAALGAGLPPSPPRGSTEPA